MGVSWHGLTWILLGRLGGGIVVLRTKYRDVPMGIDSTRLGWMGVLRWKAWIRLGCPEGISRLYGFGSDSSVFFLLSRVLR